MGSGFQHSGSSWREWAAADRGDEVNALVTELSLEVRQKVLIDLERMSSIFSGIKSLSDKAFVTFQRTCDTSAPRLIEALDARDWTQVHNLAHRLKGASGYIAGERVNEAAKKLQKCAAKLMPMDEVVNVAAAASAFAAEADAREEQIPSLSEPMPTPEVAEALLKVLLMHLDELVVHIEKCHLNV
mmetsp:Transcript_26981/g.68310  ORF Transcript_26981/g.68310 Transcript_26981/m.68310 type:complete len:186 (-) Transcript_26981:125-682(-)